MVKIFQLHDWRSIDLTPFALEKLVEVGALEVREIRLLAMAGTAAVTEDRSL